MGVWDSAPYIVVGARLRTREGRVVVIDSIDVDGHVHLHPVRGHHEDDGSSAGWMPSGAASHMGEATARDIIGPVQDEAPVMQPVQLPRTEPDDAETFRVVCAVVALLHGQPVSWAERVLRDAGLLIKQTVRVDASADADAKLAMLAYLRDAK